MSPLNLAEAYATFAARGLHCEPRSIVSIKTLTMKPSRCQNPTASSAIEPEVADAVTSLLQGVLQPGATGELMALERPAGARQEQRVSSSRFGSRDTPRILPPQSGLATRRRPPLYPMRDVTINGTYYSAVYGRPIPGPIWKAAMLGALADVPACSFVPINPELIDGLTITVPSLAGLTQRRSDRHG